MTRTITFLFSFILVFSACYSLKKSIKSSLPYSNDINWPKEYIPKDAKFFVHNEIDINASPSVIWDILIHAETWPNWYIGAKNVRIVNSSTGKLAASSSFRWNTMGLDFTSTIKEFEPPYRLSWESSQKKIKGYHAWLIIPDDDGCKLVTQESQYGWLTFFEKTFQPNKLRKLHDVWLTEIKKKAESKNN